MEDFLNTDLWFWCDCRYALAGSFPRLSDLERGLILRQQRNATLFLPLADRLALPRRSAKMLVTGYDIIVRR
jgi:hypothetical protein